MLTFKKAMAPLLITVLLLISSCSSNQPPSRFDRAQQESTKPGNNSAVVRESESGSSFNQFFPNSSGGLKRIYTQEKKGFAQAKLEKEGIEVAQLSISDALNNPSAKNKFKDSKTQIGGFPAVQQGSKSTVVLVADRFQVKVTSRDNSFTQSDRETWLGKFNLRGLANVK